MLPLREIDFLCGSILNFFQNPKNFMVHEKILRVFFRNAGI